MSVMESQIISLAIIYLTAYSGADQRKLQSVALLDSLCWEFTVTGEFPTQRASYAEADSILWRHHVFHVSVEYSITIL